MNTGQGVLQLRLCLNMIVCLCRAKTDRDVAEAIENGAASIRDLQACGIGTDCRGCHTTLRQMLAAARDSSPVPVLASAVRPDRAATGAAQ